jgi:hypothetical protein
MILDAIEALQLVHAANCLSKSEKEWPWSECLKAFPVLGRQKLTSERKQPTHLDFSEFLTASRESSFDVLLQRLNGASRCRAEDQARSIALFEDLGIPFALNGFDTQATRPLADAAAGLRAKVAEDTRCVIDTLFGGWRLMPELPVDVSAFAAYIDKPKEMEAILIAHARKSKGEETIAGYTKSDWTQMAESGSLSDTESDSGSGDWRQKIRRAPASLNPRPSKRARWA